MRGAEPSRARRAFHLEPVRLVRPPAARSPARSPARAPSRAARAGRLRDYSFGVAANIAVGLNLTAEEVREGRQHLDGLIEGMFSSRLADLGRRKRAARLARQRLDSLLEDHLDPIAKSIASGGATARGYGARRTLLEEIISAARAGGIPYSGGKWLYDLVVTVLFGCTVTAADSMALALESLAGAPDVLADLRSEHLGLRAADMVGPWGLSKMPVTDAVVREDLPLAF
ncbi:unnamed protein product [Prorocentrum cordatum]|uniref:Uncharacterized protein n=1 Tax=Prorocentrum cordatum TaxID=2364126 RepID=A0ABN9USW5_9DINO|nr:unnamed protein product [Polarella glacialis]